MIDFKQYTILSGSRIKDALIRLNQVHSFAMTLFVVDNNGILLGTLTDGDIRRGLISGADLFSTVDVVMHTSYRHIKSIDDVRGLKAMRELNISLIPLINEKHHLIEVIDISERKTRLPIDAVLMAGGKGERLRPLTLICPKPLLKIGDKAIIDYNIDSLVAHGINHISVTVNYLKEQLIEHYAEPLENGVKVECVAEEQFFGTIGALRLVTGFHNDTILVMNSDLLTNIDYEDFYLHFQEHEAMMSAAAIPYTISVPYGIFNLDGRNIKGVHEKPVYNLYANAGIYLIRKEALRYIPEGQMFNATDLIDTLAADGQKVIRYPLSGLWIDIGTPEEYHKAQELIKHLK